MTAFGLPKGTDEEKKRTAAIQDATRYAIEIPFRVMELSYQSMDTKAMTGNRKSHWLPMREYAPSVHAAP